MIKYKKYFYGYSIFVAKTIHYTKKDVYKTVIMIGGRYGGRKDIFAIYLSLNNLLRYILNIITENKYDFIKHTLNENQTFTDKVVRIEFQGIEINSQDKINFEFNYIFNPYRTRYKELRNFYRLAYKSIARINKIPLIDFLINFENKTVYTYNLVIKVINIEKKI